MLQHDQERLEKIYEGNIPPRVIEIVDKMQKLRHAHLQNGFLSGDLIVLACTLYDMEDIFKSTAEVVPKPIKEEVADTPVSKGPPVERPEPTPVNWFSTKKGTKITCNVNGTDHNGTFVGVFRAGPDKGKVKAHFSNSENEFDVFDPKDVSINADFPAPE